MNFLCVSLVTCQCNTLNVHSYFVPFFPLTNKQANQKKSIDLFKNKKKTSKSKPFKYTYILPESFYHCLVYISVFFLYYERK